MRKANRKTPDLLIARLADVQINEHDRQRAVYAMRDAEAIVDAAVWIKEKFAALGGLFLKPGLKH